MISNNFHSLSWLLHDVRSDVMISHKYMYFQTLLKTSISACEHSKYYCNKLQNTTQATQETILPSIRKNS